MVKHILQLKCFTIADYYNAQETEILRFKDSIPKNMSYFQNIY